MDVDRTTGEIHFDEYDIRVLGEPQFKPVESIERATEILHRAEQRAAANLDRASICAPEHVNKEGVRNDIARINLRLNSICTGMKTILAPTDEGVFDIEARMDEWTRWYGSL